MEVPRGFESRPLPRQSNHNKESNLNAVPKGVGVASGNRLKAMVALGRGAGKSKTFGGQSAEVFALSSDLPEVPIADDDPGTNLHSQPRAMRVGKPRSGMRRGVR